MVSQLRSESPALLTLAYVMMVMTWQGSVASVCHAVSSAIVCVMVSSAIVCVMVSSAIVSCCV